MSVPNGDLLEILQEAWHVINGASGGDWEKQSPAWARDAAAWRDAYHELRHRIEGGEAALEAKIRATLEQAVVSEEEIAALVRIACAYAEAFPANYVMRNPVPATPGEAAGIMREVMRPLEPG